MEEGLKYFLISIIEVFVPIENVWNYGNLQSESDRNRIFLAIPRRFLNWIFVPINADSAEAWRMRSTRPHACLASVR